MASKIVDMKNELLETVGAIADMHKASLSAKLAYKDTERGSWITSRSTGRANNQSVGANSHKQLLFIPQASIEIVKLATDVNLLIDDC